MSRRGAARKKLEHEAPPVRPLITADTLVADAVNSHPEAKEVLLARGLPCYRCEVAFHETLATGCAPLGLDVANVVQALNALHEDAGSGSSS